MCSEELVSGTVYIFDLTYFLLTVDLSGCNHIVSQEESWFSRCLTQMSSSPASHTKGFWEHEVGQ